MTIKRNYWNKPIEEFTGQKGYTNKDCVKINKNYYFGRSLKKDSGEKLKLFAFKIAPVILASIIFAPIAIPVFALTNVYRNTGRHIQEIKHNRKFEYISDKKEKKITNLFQKKAAPLPYPKEIIESIIRKSLNNLPLDKVKSQLQSLACVGKGWDVLVNSLSLDLLNSLKISLEDLPTISTRKEAIHYIKENKSNIKSLTINISPSFQWSDKDIQSIFETCPHLKKLVTKSNEGCFLAVIERSTQDITPLDMTSLINPLNWKQTDSLFARFPSFFHYERFWGCYLSEFQKKDRMLSIEDAVNQLEIMKSELFEKFLVQDATPILNEAAPGLNMVGKCINEKCKEFNKFYAFPKGDTGKIDLARVLYDTTCLCCHKSIGTKDDEHAYLIKDSAFSVETIKRQGEQFQGLFKIPKGEPFQFKINANLVYLNVHLQKL